MIFPSLLHSFIFFLNILDKLPPPPGCGEEGSLYTIVSNRQVLRGEEKRGPRGPGGNPEGKDVKSSKLREEYQV